MSFFIFLLALFVLFVLYISLWFAKRRQTHLNEMNAIYDKMELYTLSHNLHHRKDVVEFLIPYKFFVVNTDYTEIKELIAEMENVPQNDLDERKKRYDEMAANFPKELRQLSSEFNHHLHRAIKLTSVSVRSIAFFIVFIFALLLLSLFRMSFGLLKKIILTYSNFFWPGISGYSWYGASHRLSVYFFS